VIGCEGEDPDLRDDERETDPDVANERARHTLVAAVVGAFRRSPRAAKVYFVVCTLYVVGIAVWIAITDPHDLLRAPTWSALLGGSSGVVLGCAIALFRVAQGERWKVRKLHWGVTPRHLHDMLLALPMLAFTAGMLSSASSVLMIPHATQHRPWLLLFSALTAYVTVVSGKVLRDATRYLYFHAREQAAAAEGARAEAADAQLAALQAQVNPHFLFNALNTIAALVRMDPRAAEATTENLAQVLRRTLDRTRRTQCTVDDEVDFLRAWLAVEEQRFGDRLRVVMEVEPGTGGLHIPTMTLQPLVENSLKHGIAGKLAGGVVRVCVHTAGDRLRLEVEDDGPGFAREPGDGTGLSNLRRRLETIYGPAATLSIGQPASGARVVVELPVQPGEAQPAPAAA
jgi:signal transduction histidine kinase